jgi:hypothetical protein
MMILVAAMFLLPLGLVALYLYVSGVFTNRRAFQFGFYILLVFFALTIGIGIHSCQGYDLPATTPVSLSEVLPEPCAALQQTRCTPPWDCNATPRGTTHTDVRSPGAIASDQHHLLAWILCPPLCPGPVIYHLSPPPVTQRDNKNPLVTIKDY